MKKSMIGFFLVGMLAVSTVGFAQNKEAAKQQKVATKVEKKNQAAEGKGSKKTAHLKKAAVKPAGSTKAKENKKK